MKSIILCLALVVVCCTSLFAGGPISRVIQPIVPPAPIYIPVPVAKPVVELPKVAFGNVMVYMTDYRTELILPGYPRFNFGEAFKWSAKEAVTELSLGVSIPLVADGSFSWVLPVTRSGNGIPLVPIGLGGSTFGPRPADTIFLKTTLAGERFMLSTPALLHTRQIMPTIMCEWWHLQAEVNGTPQAATTSQVPVNVKQDFNKLLFGEGVSGEAKRYNTLLSYKAIYTTGGHTSGWLAQADVGYTQSNISATLGYRYNIRDLSFDPGDFQISTSGPYATLRINF